MNEDHKNMDQKTIPTFLIDGTSQQESVKEFGNLMSRYKCAMIILESKFKVLNEEYSALRNHDPISTIKTRLKKPSSIQEKLKRKGLPLTLAAIEEHLNDVAGICVICSFQEDVYTLANALLRQEDITLIAKKDYIQQPKPNGYRSLHLIVAVPVYMTQVKQHVKVEIQLRTIAMDFWASLEHQFRYKRKVFFTQEMTDEFYQCAQLSADLDERMDQLRKTIASIPTEL